MKFFFRPITKSIWKFISSDLVNYGFCQEGKFYYNHPLTVSQLARGLKIAPEKLKDRFQKYYLPSSLPIPEPEMQEFLLESDWDYEKVTNWNLLDSYHHWWTTPDSLKLIDRPPVIVVMGHVDHGKTTLLDWLRSTNEAPKETGAITQKIGVSTVGENNEKFTFLDTPGHQFFSMIREQGSQIADLAILVVAGNEGVKPQTREAVEKIQKAQIPVVVFINKSDLPDFNLSKTSNELSKLGLISSEFGGNTHFVTGSATKKEGWNKLFVAFNSVKKKLNLRIPIEQSAQAIVLDHVLAHTGFQTSLLVTKGTLTTQDFFWINGNTGHMQNLKNSLGQRITQVNGGEGVFAWGIKGEINIGDTIYFAPNPELFKFFPKQKPVRSELSSVPDFFAEDSQSRKPSQNIIVKFGGKGFEQALRSQLPKLKENYQTLQFLNISAGDLTQNDINHAKAKSAIIITFNLAVKSEFVRQIRQQKIVHFSSQMLHEIWDYLVRLANFPPTKKEIIVHGKFELLKIFPHSKFKAIAGGVVRSGEITRDKKMIRIYRDNKIIAEKLQIHSLRTERQFIDLAKTGMECGVIFANYADFAVGDIFEQYTEKIVINEEKVNL